MKGHEYRARAEELRRTAAASSDPVQKAEYERLASAWDELARTYEQRLKPQQPKP